MSAWRRIALSLGVTLLVVGFSLSAIAQEQRTGSGLIISPTQNEFQIEPGQSKVIKISLKNVSGVDIVAKVAINDFEADNLTGVPRIITDTTKSSPNSVRNFLDGVTDIELKNDEKKEFEIGVNIPANTPAGGYYGIVRYSAIPVAQQTPDSGQVALTASVGTLVLVEVPGNITEQIQISSLRVLQNKKSGSFFLKTPDEVAIEIKNIGNSFSKPFGRVNVSKAGGGEIYSYELNNTDPKGNILPASSRTFTDKLENVKSPGRYTVTANISHGKGGEILTYQSSFWYVPSWLLGLIIAAILALIVGGYVLYRTRFRGSRAKKRR